VHLHIPPLRDRPEDVLPLAEYFLKRYAERYRKPVHGFDHSAITALNQYTWPGNVRELGHAVERAVLLATARDISAGDLGLGAPSTTGDTGFEQMTLEEAERTLIERALKRFDGNVTEAARALGVSRSALYRRLASLGVKVD